MQPYIFPYMGYFSLLSEADVFVYYDDVDFIKKGWINRNRILINGTAHTFTVPLENASQNTLILDLKLSNFPQFRSRFQKSLQLSYSKAPHFETGMAYVERVLSADTRSICALAIESVEKAALLLGITTSTCRSSDEFRDTRGADRSGRLIEIAKKAGCARYVNAISGTALYDKSYFAAKGIRLDFLKPSLMAYRQRSPKPVLGLSIIDLLMHLGVEEVRHHVANYSLV